MRPIAARPGSSSWAPPTARLSLRRSLALPRGAAPRWLAIALVLLAAIGGGWLWLRNSSLVAVEHVQITGVQGVDAGPIEAALRGAAWRTSTLDVNVGALRAAVASFPVVRSLSVSASPPHALRIDVVEQLPVAVLSEGGVRTAVAADGVVLGPSLVSSSLAAIAANGPPLRSGSVRDATVRTELQVLGAAPATLLGWVGHVYDGHEGLTVALRGGPLVYFGDAARPHAKWAAAARVLADPTSAGAAYIDVRDPSRPVAGGVAGVSAGASSSSTATAGEGATATPSTSSAPTAALEHALAGAVSGGSAGTTPATTEPAPAGATTEPAAAGRSTPETAATGTTGGGAGGSGAGAAEPATTGTAGTSSEHTATGGAGGAVGGSAPGGSAQGEAVAGGAGAQAPQPTATGESGGASPEG